METFQKRMQFAIKRCGGQTELAREIYRRYGKNVSPQRIQYLASETVAKPAKGSRITPEIAAVAGLRAEWLALGIGRRDEPNKDVDPDQPRRLKPAQVVDVKVKGSERRIKMELTQDAIDVAKAFMDLPARERLRFQRAIMVAALPYSRDVPDEQLSHLAAPKEAPAKRKLPKGTQ